MGRTESGRSLCPVPMCATETGGDTHEGGPSFVEYSGIGAGLGELFLGVCLAAGESYLLENASAVRFFFPGTCNTINLNNKDFNLKFNSLGFSISSKF